MGDLEVERWQAGTDDERAGFTGRPSVATSPPTYSTTRSPSPAQPRCARLTLDLHRSHFTMTFDASPPVVQRLNSSLRRDPLVVRWMLMRKGDKMWVGLAVTTP